MNAKQIKTANVPKREHSNYWSKGSQFFKVMQFCLQDKEWDGVLLNGLHACISVNDALTVFHAGKKSISNSHQDASELLKQSLSQTDVRKNAQRLLEILNLKHLVEYEPRLFTQKEAHDFAKKVERFILWAKEQLPS